MYTTHHNDRTPIRELICYQVNLLVEPRLIRNAGASVIEHRLLMDGAINP